MSVSRGEGIEFKQKLLVTERSICVMRASNKVPKGEGSESHGKSERADLRGADLNGAILIGANFAGAHLSSREIDGVDFTEVA